MKAFLILLVAIQLIRCIKAYESPYEEQFHCKRNGETSKPKETILVLSPHDEYFFKKLGIFQPSGKCEFEFISFVCLVKHISMELPPQCDRTDSPECRGTRVKSLSTMPCLVKKDNAIIKLQHFSLLFAVGVSINFDIATLLQLVFIVKQQIHNNGEKEWQ